METSLVYPRRHPIGSSRPFLGFAPFQRHQIREPGCPPRPEASRADRVCLTQPLPLSRFLTSSGVCVLRTLAALFRAAAARRVYTFRVFPSVGSRNRLRSFTLLTLQDDLICDRAWASYNQPKSVTTGQTLSSTSRCLRPPGQAVRRAARSQRPLATPRPIPAGPDPTVFWVDASLMVTVGLEPKCPTNPAYVPHPDNVSRPPFQSTGADRESFFETPAPRLPTSTMRC